jgi:hypothetical protein
MLPIKPRGVPRVNDHRVLNGIFWVLRSGAPWRDLPDSFGPYTTCYNRFVRWRRAGETLSAVVRPISSQIYEEKDRRIESDWLRRQFAHGHPGSGERKQRHGKQVREI